LSPLAVLHSEGTIANKLKALSTHGYSPYANTSFGILRNLMDNPLRVGLTLAAWMAATALASVCAWLAGADARRLAEAAVVSLSPAVTGFILLGRFNEAWARIYFVSAWALSAAMLAASSGGPASATSTLFIIAPAFALAIGDRALVAIAALASATGFVAAALLGGGVESEPLGWAPALYAAFTLLLCTAIFARQANAHNGESERSIAEAAHELRTPVGHMIGFAEMIERELYGPVGERNREYAGLIRASGVQLLDLIARRLDLSRLATGRFALDLGAVDAREIAADVVRLSHGSAAAKNITLEQDLPNAETFVRADSSAVRQMLTNLIGNAIKFTPEGGRVRLAMRSSAAKLHLEVSDTGPGVAAPDRRRVMRPFERGAAARDVEGAGLGLALVRSLARLHGGDLRLAAAPGGGLLACVRLPLNGPK
jgi:signal transduction histidine kinase